MDLIPKQIAEYLESLSINRLTSGYLKLDKNGAIIDWTGEVALFNSEAPKAGEDIYEYCSILEGILPLESKQAVLPRIEMTNNLFADIHLLFDENYYWIIFIDTTQTVNYIRDFLQDHNETILKKTQSKNLPNDTEEPEE